MKTKFTLLAMLAAGFAINLLAATASDLRPADLRCEYRREPLGVDVPQPRLFWKLESPNRGQLQTAWQIQVASSSRALEKGQADCWDSGKVISAETTHIVYAGKPLKSSQVLFWKIRVWDREGQPSGWSAATSWTMGVLEEGDWQAAKWIGASDTNAQSLLFRRELVVKAGLKRAVIHVCGLGQYELSVNGQKAGEDLLAPGWTKYDRTCLYDTLDLTPLLRPGRNALGIVLGNGMYNVQGGRYLKFKGSFGPIKAIALARIEYENGVVEFVSTDQNWLVAASPITFSCIYGGEDYDARLDPPGWDQAGFDAREWHTAIPTSGPGGILRGLSCAALPIRAFDTFKPVKVNSRQPGVEVYDLGQNVSLMPRLSVAGPAGAVVRLIPGELLKPDGSVDRGSCGGGSCYWQYTLAGRGSEKWFPKFFYHGCRYLQVERTAAAGLALPEVQTLEGVVVHSSATPVGEFECSNPLFNRIRTLVRWAQRSNMMSLMTDCPHREKLGWLEEDHLNGPALRYEFDLAPLFAKAMNDMADSQRPNGLIPDIAPEYVVFNGGFVDSPEWGSAFILVPWQQYEFTGDLDLLRQHYAQMARYVAYLGGKSANHIVSHGLGDWYDIGPKSPGVAQLTPIALTATAFYYDDVRILAQTARLLGKTADAERYARLADDIRQAFNRAFFHSDSGQYATGSQTANAIPLVMGLVEPAARPAVLDTVVRDVRARGNALTAGDVGYRYLLRALAEGGRSEVIFDLNNQSEKPGYGYQLKQGATSLTEAWDAGRQSSQNHFMLGQITEWFYHDLAGISCDPTGPGFKKIRIQPAVVGDVTWTKASWDSIRGRIVCDWKRQAGTFSLKVSVPPNVTATVFLPVKTSAQITEGGQPIVRAKGVKSVGQTDGQAVFEVESGSYFFEAPL